MRTIIGLDITKDFVIELTYNNCKKIKIDFKNKIDKGGIYEPLSNKSFFSTAKISPNGRFICWKEDIEICADSLWYEGSGELFSEDLKKEAS